MHRPPDRPAARAASAACRGAGSGPNIYLQRKSEEIRAERGEEAKSCSRIESTRHRHPGGGRGARQEDVYRAEEERTEEQPLSVQVSAVVGPKQTSPWIMSS